MSVLPHCSDRLTPRGMGPTILVIDDDAGMRESMTIRLRSIGLDVLACDHPDAATDLVVRHHPDLILLDIEMPRFSGVEFHDTLRFSRRADGIPVIYVSGHVSPALIEEAYRQGARAFIKKPFDSAELVATVKGVLHTITRPVSAHRVAPSVEGAAPAAV